MDANKLNKNNIDALPTSDLIISPGTDKLATVFSDIPAGSVSECWPDTTHRQHSGDNISTLTFPRLGPDNRERPYLTQNLVDEITHLDPDRGDRDHSSLAASEIIPGPCFGEGTLIRTARGERPVESLKAGDLVETFNQGMRRIRRIGHMRFTPEELSEHPNFSPVLIRAGALAPNMPDRDLLLSQQHGVLLSAEIAQELFGEDELLVAAKHLTSLAGIKIVNPDEGITYWYVLFDRHQVIVSNGAWAESMFAGPNGMHSVGDWLKRDALALLPHTGQSLLRPGAVRRFIKRPKAHAPTGQQSLLGNYDLKTLAA